MTPEQRIEIYKKSPEEIQALYNSSELGSKISAISVKFQIVDLGKLVNVVGDTILGQNKISNLSSQLQNKLLIGADDAQRMTSELLEFLSPVIKREEEERNIKKEDIEKLAKTFEESSKARPKEISPEGKPEDIKPIRTMKADMTRAHGYGVYRDHNPTESDDEPVVKAAPQDSLLEKADNNSVQKNVGGPTPQESGSAFEETASGPTNIENDGELPPPQTDKV